MPEEAPPPYRAFHSIRTQADNELDCNLTELNATQAVDKGYMSHNDWLAHCTRYAYVQKWLLKQKDPVTILDVGCGDLQLPRYFWRNRTPVANIASYWGLELRAKKAWMDSLGFKVPVNVIQLDLIRDNPRAINDRLEDGQMEWPEQFDCVVCFETFEHVPRDCAPELMDSLFGWTKPGGKCFFSTPNAGVSDSTADNHKDADGQSREWTYGDKIDCATNAGFRVDDTFGTFCGTTRLPAEVQERFKTDPELAKIKKYLHHAWFTCMMAAPYPEHSNNALFDMTRPLDSAEE